MASTRPALCWHCSVWVRGPWDTVTSSSDPADVIDQLCPAIMRLDRARDRDYGQEYCGAIYSLGDGTYHASHPSPLGTVVPVGPAKMKQCYPPRRVLDSRGRTSILADFHSHPWSPSPMSDRDMRASTQLWSIRIQFDTTCHVLKYVPHSDEATWAGELYERQGRRWNLIGIIKLPPSTLRPRKWPGSASLWRSPRRGANASLAPWPPRFSSPWTISARPAWRQTQQPPQSSVACTDAIRTMSWPRQERAA